MHMAAKRKSNEDTRELDDLSPFPLQANTFDDLSDNDIQQLADDIERNGLHSPVEILGDNTAGYPEDTIISGHQRLRALRILGRTDTPVRVRDDLAAATKEQIEQAFIEPNLNRRQLHPLDKARSVLRLLEIERSRARGKADNDGELSARDRVSKAIGVSGRTLSRYLRVLDTPREVQTAFRNQTVPLVVAEKVADLSASKMAAIAKRIRAGENAKKVILEYSALRTSRDQTPRRTFWGIMVKLRALMGHAPDLDGLTIDTLECHRDVICDGYSILARLRERLDENESNPGHDVHAQ